MNHFHGLYYYYREDHNPFEGHLMLPRWPAVLPVWYASE